MTKPTPKRRVESNLYGMVRSLGAQTITQVSVETADEQLVEIDLGTARVFLMREDFERFYLVISAFRDSLTTSP